MIDVGYKEKYFYFFRFWYDLLFFMIVNIIIMNLVFGIIIDSFTGKKIILKYTHAYLFST